MKLSLIVALVAALPTLGLGATIVQTQEYGFVPDSSQTLTFAKFDTQGGNRILNSVTVTVVLNKTGGRFEVDNDSATAGTISLTHSVVGSLTATGVALLREDFSAIGQTGTLTAVNQLTNQSVAATTGDATNTFNATGGADYVLFQPGNSTATSSGTIGSLFLAGYQGTGTFTTTVNGNQSVGVTGLGGLQQAFTVSNVSGTVTVTYDYTSVVPESSSALLGGLGMLLLLRRRR